MARSPKLSVQRLEEPARDHDPVDDREIGRVGIAGGGRGDDLHHDRVLRERFGLPWLDVAGSDEVEEPVGLKVDRARPRFG